MVASSEIVLAYYLGFGFVTLLAWVIVAPEPGRGLTEPVAARYLRWSRLVGVMGILHPALGFAIRDIVDQVGIELPDDRELDAKHAQASTVVNVYATASVVVAAAILVVNVGAWSRTPVAWLPPRTKVPRTTYHGPSRAAALGPTLEARVPPRRGAMRALVFHGPGDKSWDEVPEPKIDDDEDVIVQIDAVTICGTDLHILKGDVPEVAPGRVLGHEAVGTVVETGVGVRNRRVGDRVLVSCISACGRCPSCRRGQYGLCQGGGGWVLGHLIDGVQAELARVPFGDTSTYVVPEGLSDEQVLYLADILPTGYEVGVLNGKVQPGDVVAIVGAGPVGLAALVGAKLFSPGHVLVVDPAAPRRQAALQFGADSVADPDDAERAVRRLTDGRGADVTIEAVGIPATFEQCCTLVRPGGHIANIGVHGQPVTLHLEELWIKDITLTTGLVDTFAIPTLLDLIEAERIDAPQFTSHRFALGDMMAAYDTFARAAETKALKVLMTR